MAESSQSQGEKVYRALRRLVRELLARKPGGHLVEPVLEALDLQLPLPLRGTQAEPDVFAARLIAVLDEQLDEAIRQAAAFRPGHAFCHRCESSSCEHSSPPSPVHVFADYGPTGTPTWMPFAQYCLAIRHPQVDRLYGDSPAFVTLIQDAETLRGPLLKAWQHRSSELVGQLIAGYYRLPGGEREVLALTFQVRASRPNGARGPRRLGLNILGRSPAGEPLGMQWDRAGEPPWRKAVQWAQAALHTVSETGGGRKGHRSAHRADLDERVAGILAGLARRLERDQRGRARRTSHAERRHQSGQRPTRKALDDVRLARPEAFLVDERSETLVILGDRGRTHFFTPAGRLVSSVRYSREAIEKKRKLGLWRAASSEETRGLLEAVASAAAEENAGG
jgi:hypothetical protein